MSENMISCKITSGENKIDLPVPSDIQFGKERICKEQRALDGTMIIDMIAVKNSLEVVWDIMGDSDLKTLKNTVESVGNTFFDMEIKMRPAEVYKDASTGTPQIGQESAEVFKGKVYLSDLSYVPYFINGGFAWKDVSMKVVEK